MKVSRTAIHAEFYPYINDDYRLVVGPLLDLVDSLVVNVSDISELPEAAKKIIEDNDFIELIPNNENDATDKMYRMSES